MEVCVVGVANDRDAGVAALDLREHVMVRADRQEGGEGAALVGAAAAAYALIVRRWSACRGGVIAVDELILP